MLSFDLLLFVVWILFQKVYKKMYSAIALFPEFFHAREDCVSTSCQPEELLGWLYNTWVKLSINAVTLPSFSIQHGRNHHLPWCYYSFIDWLDSFIESFSHLNKVNISYNPLILSHLRISTCGLYVWSEWNCGWT